MVPRHTRETFRPVDPRLTYSKGQPPFRSPDPASAAQVYPAAFWYAMMGLPTEEEVAPAEAPVESAEPAEATPAPADEAPATEPAAPVRPSPTPSAAPVAKREGGGDSYLDDLAAMESELSSGWEDEQAEPDAKGDAPEKKSE